MKFLTILKLNQIIKKDIGDKKFNKNNKFKKKVLQ